MYLVKTAGNSTALEILPPLHCIHFIAFSTVCIVINGIVSICKLVKTSRTRQFYFGEIGRGGIFLLC